LSGATSLDAFLEAGIGRRHAMAGDEQQHRQEYAGLFYDF